jgi:sugar lactone lactonase YvrE
MLKHLTLAVALFVTLSASAVPPDALATFRAADAANTDGRVAYKAHDYASAEASFRKAVALAPQSPRALNHLAAALALQGKGASALEVLSRAAQMGAWFDLDADSDFAGLKQEPGYAKLVAAFAASRQPMCKCTMQYRGTPDAFLAEGIAVDGEQLLVASIRGKRIVAIRSGAETEFAVLPSGLSPYGIAIDRTRSLLWVAAQDESGALLAFDLAGGRLVRRIDAPKGAMPGDVVVAGDGTVYVSDGGGLILRLAPGASALERVASLVSPQGMIARGDGMLVVADYAMGLVMLDPVAGVITPVGVPADVTTLGIDGLAALADGSLIATQNGIAPARIVRLRLSADGRRLEHLEVLAVNASEAGDPSLVASDGSNVYAVGVSQWASFDDGRKPPARPLEAWTLLRVTP